MKLNHVQKIFTAPQWRQLQANNQANNGGKTTDFRPVVKFFAGGAATWLLTECDENGDAFGLCDLGFGEPELGYVSVVEMAECGKVERDQHFKATKRLSEYADEAKDKGRIVA